MKDLIEMTVIFFVSCLMAILAYLILTSLFS